MIGLEATVISKAILQAPAMTTPNKSMNTMQNCRFIFSCIVLLFLGFFQANGQSESLESLDSSNTLIIDDFRQKLDDIANKRLPDSIKKEALTAEINVPKTADNLKKAELQQQLDELSKIESQRYLDKKTKIDSMRLNAKSFPVHGFFGDTLFVVYSKLGSLSAADRAAAISKRVRKLGNDFKYNALTMIDAESIIDIMHGETIVMSISENDAIWANKSKAELADEYTEVLNQAILTYKDQTSFLRLLKKTGLALFVLGILGGLLYYTGKLFKWTAKKIAEQEGKRINGVKIKDYALSDAHRMVGVILSINTIVKWVVFFLLAYIALPIIFGFFPWTQDFAETLFGYVLDPLKAMATGFWNYLPNLITIAVIFMVFRYIIKGFHFLKDEIRTGKLKLSGFYPDWANPTYQIIRILLYSFMFVLIFPYLPGSDSPVFKGVSVFLGFLFTFGSAGSLSNIIAGIVLTYMRLFKLGDRVKIGELTGDVIEKSMLVTRIRTIKNEIISIPNSTVMSSHTVNYNNEGESGAGLIIHTTVTIGYDAPWKTVHKALIDAVGRTDLLLKDPEPFVLQTSLDDFYVSYQINAYTRHPNKQATIYSDLHSHIQDCCNEASIEILSPHYRAARDGNKTTIPANYLGKGYRIPSFNLRLKKDAD